MLQNMCDKSHQKISQQPHQNHKNILGGGKTQTQQQQQKWRGFTPKSLNFIFLLFWGVVHIIHYNNTILIINVVTVLPGNVTVLY
jgi:hypothetical protein